MPDTSSMKQSCLAFQLMLGLVICAPAMTGALAAPVAPTARPVFRCDSSYSNVPCDEGREVKVDDARSPAEKAAADAAARETRATAEALERERLRQEAAARAARPKVATHKAVASAPPVVRVNSQKKKPKMKTRPADEDILFTAAGPATSSTKASAAATAAKKTNDSAP